MNRRTFLRTIAGAAAAVPLVAAGADRLEAGVDLAQPDAEQTVSLGYIVRPDGTLELQHAAFMHPPAWPELPRRHPNCRCVLAPIDYRGSPSDLNNKNPWLR